MESRYEDGAGIDRGNTEKWIKERESEKEREEQKASERKKK